ncbi:MAG: thiamine phosphate synthase [Endomicrobia bacterium]|nr:thiamine phosphate synthase [Endomicrobiia bacterium]
MRKIKGVYCILPEFEKIDYYITFTKNLLRYNPDVIQLRIKNMSDRFFFDVARKLKKIISVKKIPFIINNRIDICLLVNADGVHLGQDDLPINELRRLSKKLIIGFSTHSVKQAINSLRLPVDYISVGPVFESKNKKEYGVVGLDTLKEVLEIVSRKISVVAIGGINTKNIELLKKVKPDAVAVIDALKEINLKYTISKLKSIFV